MQEGGELGQAPQPEVKPSDSPTFAEPDTSRPLEASDEIDVQFSSPEEYRAFIASIDALKARVAEQDIELDELREMMNSRGGSGASRV